MTKTSQRKQAGRPGGGQFEALSRPESDVDLGNRRISESVIDIVLTPPLRRGRASESELADLAESADPHFRQFAARHGRSHPEVRLALSHDADWEVRAAVVASPAVEIVFINRLANDPEPQVRLAVARHPLVDNHDLRRMTYDPDYVVRGAAQIMLNSRGVEVEPLDLDKLIRDERKAAVLAARTRPEYGEYARS